MAVPGRRGSCVLHAALAVALALLANAAAEARIVKIEITSRESPALEGRTFGDGGAQKELRVKAKGDVAPADPRNAVITDIQLAPRGPNGKVSYSMDVVILKPIDLRKGNRRLFVDINNRGNMRWDRMNDGPSNVNNPVK